MPNYCRLGKLTVLFRNRGEHTKEAPLRSETNLVGR